MSESLKRYISPWNRLLSYHSYITNRVQPIIVLLLQQQQQQQRKNEITYSITYNLIKCYMTLTRALPRSSTLWSSSKAVVVAVVVVAERGAESKILNKPVHILSHHILHYSAAPLLTGFYFLFRKADNAARHTFQIHDWGRGNKGNKHRLF